MCPLEHSTRYIFPSWLPTARSWPFSWGAMVVRLSLQTRNVVTGESTPFRMSYTSNRPVAFMVKNTEYLDLLQQPPRKSAFCSLCVQNFIYLIFTEPYVLWYDDNVNFETTPTRMATESFNTDKQDISRNCEIHSCIIVFTWIASCFALFHAKYITLFYFLCAD